MILVISGTNRSQSATRIIAEHYVRELRELTTEEVHLTDLEHLPSGILSPEMYGHSGEDSPLSSYQDTVFIPSRKIVFVAPEYNGSFPGVLKVFLDALSVRNYKETFQGKKAALVGVSTGRAGNLRGMEHLTGILHYLKIDVLPNKLPISQVNKLLQGSRLDDRETKDAIRQQLAEFLVY